MMQKLGEAVACAGDNAGEVNDKHGIEMKTAAMAMGAMQKAKELDEKHKIAVNTKKFVNSAVEKAGEIVEKHHVVEKSKDAVNRASVVARDVNEKHQLNSKTKSRQSMPWPRPRMLTRSIKSPKKTKTAAKLTMKHVALGVESISKAMGSDKKDVGACKK